jgi:response regulator RpfG family c-di-GMP phosphodiesterase
MTVENSAASPAVNEEAAQQAALLFVDDEANILSALKRLFRPLGYRIFTAGSGAAGLEILAREQVDLVVSDMRMPEMNGAQFLEKVRQQWPDTVRILLTGYAEIGSTIDAINKGQIFRYISKPWEDSDITLTVKHALERRDLERRNQGLEELTRKQNEELKQLNSGLEEKVKARTEEVRQTMKFLEQANERLGKSFLASIRAFSNMIEIRSGGVLAGHAEQVADHARKLAQRLGMEETQLQDVVFAALLKDLGKLSLPDRLLARPLSALDAEERGLLAMHPIQGQAALMSLEQLHDAGKMIRSQHECYDGSGYPDRLSGLAIPLGARILAVAGDYHALQAGLLQPKRLKSEEALAFLVANRGKRYDPVVVDAFVALRNEAQTEIGQPEIMLSTTRLKSGMMLARDLASKDGTLLLARDHVLDDAIIAQLRTYEKAMSIGLSVSILTGKGG